MTSTQRRVVLFCIVGCVLTIIALGVMLLTGYVPTHMGGPTNERLWTMLFGLADGLLIAGWFAFYFGGRA